MSPKTRKQKLDLYQQKYSQVPIDFSERLNWMIDQYHLSPKKMDEIIAKKYEMERYLKYEHIKIILYEDPDGAKRPRFRIVSKANYMEAAMQYPDFVHVYSPNAADDSNFMHRLIDEELVQLRWFIQTPCRCTINTYSKTPSSFNITDTFLAEMGYHMNTSYPDWDNIGKKYSDMINANVWLDDNLVTSGTVNKFYSILPRIEIFVDYMNYATNRYQYQKITDRKTYRPEFPIEYLGPDGRPI